MAELPTIDQAFGAVPEPPPPLFPNSPLKKPASAFPAGMVRPGRENPNDASLYPQGVEGVGSIEVSEEGTPLNVLTIAQEHGRKLTNEEMLQKIKEGHDFGAFDSPENATAFSQAAFGGGKEPEKPQGVPYVDDVFGAVDDSWTRRADKQLQQSMNNIFNSFGYGLKEYFGPETVTMPKDALSPETKKMLQDYGILPDYLKGQGDVVRSFVDASLRTTVAGLALLERSGKAVSGAALSTLESALQEMGILDKGRRQISSIVEDPQLGPLVNAINAPLLAAGVPEAAAVGASVRAAARRAATTGADLAAARASGALGEGEAGYYGARPVSPENAEARVAAAREAGIEPPAPEPPPADLNELARRIEPDAINQFESLAAEGESLRQRLSEAVAGFAESPEAAEARAAQEEMSNIFLRPQTEEVFQPKLPAPPEGPVTSLPVVSREGIEEASLAAEQNAITRELRDLPRGGSRAVDTLARLETVERNLAAEGITPAERRALNIRRDEILTDTTPEKLRAEAAPIERRRTLLNRREAIAQRLDEIAMARAEARFQAAQAGIRAALEANPEVAEIRAELDRVQTEQTALLPKITSAYDQAREMMPPEAPEVAKAIESMSKAEGAGAAPPTRTTTGLRTVEGTGPTKVRGLAEGVEAQAIEKELTDTFGDLPEYQQVSMFEQAVMAEKLLAEKPEDALAVAMGQKAPPRNVLPESVFVAVERKAIAEGDVETLRQLATQSKLTAAATTMGQRIRTLGERDRLSPVDAIKDVQDARREALAARDAKAVDNTVKEIRAAARKGASTRQDWSAFIESIQCAE